jgi:fimbrial isopeptide formation D2 family protein/LPXTG-motif cell wall-anchored protein
MKKMKKIFALLIAMVMVLGMSTMAFAAETGSIKITPPTGTDASTTNTYKIYKVFDAVGNGSAISYKVKSNHTGVPTGFILDDGGNVLLGTVKTEATSTSITTMVGGVETIIEPQTTELTATQIAAIAAYVTEADLVDTITSTGTNVAEKTGLENGYYYVTTSTGTAVTITTTNPNAEVNDKNVITPPDKKITGVYNIEDGTINEGSFDADGQKALAQLGSKVEYEATVTKSHGAKNYVFHDVMGTGLTYNNDVKVYNGTTEVQAGTNTFNTTTASGDTITVTFADAYIQGLADGTVLTIKYSGTVNSDALTVDTGKNTATLSYGDNNSVIPSPNTPVVYNARITVTKVDGDNQPLAGAGFILKNSDNKYYIKNGNDVDWGTEANATVLTTAIVEGKAVIEFTGLPDGRYTLIEKVVPEGYNKAADEAFTISAHNYENSNLKLTSTVVNNAGAVLPSTGGMGTKLFYIIGAILVVGAGVILVARRRTKKD